MQSPPLNALASRLRRRLVPDSVVAAGEVGKALLEALTSGDTEALPASDVLTFLDGVLAQLVAADRGAYFAHGVARRVRALLLEELGKVVEPPIEPSAGSGATGGTPPSASAAARASATAVLAAEAARRSRHPRLVVDGSGSGSAEVSAVKESGGGNGSGDSARMLATPFRTVRGAVLDAVAELLDELDSAAGSMETQVGGFEFEGRSSRSLHRIL